MKLFQKKKRKNQGINKLDADVIIKRNFCDVMIRNYFNLTK